MFQESKQPRPEAYPLIAKDTEDLGFPMASDELTCRLLGTLAASKVAGNFLELGTGTGLSTAWIMQGMDANSRLISIDNDPACLRIANRYLGKDPRLQLLERDGGEWIENNSTLRFDYIFADTWHGKYLLLEETLSLLRIGGFYLVDDMLPQPNWPAGHEQKAANLIAYLESRSDLLVTKLDWASGLVLAVKK